MAWPLFSSVPFERDDKKYVMTVMYGQGSSWMLRTEASHKIYKKRMAELDGEKKRKRKAK